MLARIGIGVIWVLALLAVMLSLDRLYQADAEDGSLELLALAALPLELVALAKGAAHWLTSGLVAGARLAAARAADAAAGRGALGIWRSRCCSARRR